MKKNAPYEINWATNTITVSKRFMEASTIIGQGTYATMMELRKLNMPISVREIRRKKTGPMWSTERMEWYLDHVEDSAEYWKKYNVLDGNSRAMKWGWFKKTFPHCQKLPILTDDLKYKVHPEEYEGKKEKNWVRSTKVIDKNEAAAPQNVSVQTSKDTKNQDLVNPEVYTSAAHGKTSSEEDNAA